MFNNNKVNMIISLLCAIALWFFVVGQVDPKTEKKIGDVPIEFINEDSLTDNGLAVAGIDYDRAAVTVEGNRADLNRIKASDIRVTADLKDLRRGTNTVTLKATVPRDAELAAVNPETVDIEVENRVTESKPVEVKFKGETEEGTEPGNIDVTPDNIQVTGAESQVAKVYSVVATVDISKIKGDGSYIEAKARPESKSGKRISNVTLSTNTVDVSCEIMVTKEVDLEVKTVGKVPENVQVDDIQIPEKVFIKGSKENVEGIERVTAADVDISAVKETTELPLEIYLPYGIELANDSQSMSVKVVIKELATQEFEISSSAVKLEGIGDGLAASMEEKTLKVTVKGEDSVLESLTVDNLTLRSDLSGLEKGMHKVRIDVACAADVKSITISPDRAEVTIREE